MFPFDILKNFKQKMDHPERTKEFKELTEQYGYIFEEHKVVTKDDYILKVFRINSQNNNKKKPAVLLQHGLLCSADNWINNGMFSIGFILASAGYDVWLANSRGSKHSRSHLTLNPDSEPSFWDFTFQEMGYFDLPSVVAYIKNQTDL